MPFKDKNKVRQYQGEWVRQKRAKGSTDISPDIRDSANVAPWRGELSKERQVRGFNHGPAH